ncbi:dynein assembly factor 5, axonemal-like isoform X1 [Drosophila innubila]|uniref:dynein assembly factor 5, axonemal-like isoform X1 n=1 Tax=Drosophila innubila TaxID=198719 RepID=UPI00148DC3E3|nr:dynein assembly factor 5, axonemal-like isoform X1 [Drosophila innubila]XP_034486483.1 dynein assembly factor 5, axonemal-like isoform X1 [Drosophila innubila]XP_034486484.1 dynein assembly factor 5, axonemal-like isoform X1 [Drosophila innubila]
MSFDLDTKLICTELESSDHRKRSATLLQLREQCEKAPESVSSDAIAADFDELYLHLLKCYADRFESVRGRAVQAVSAFLERLPPLDFHLLNVVSTLAERMGQTETVEPSEEIRLLYIEQLHLMLRKYAKMGNVGVFRECYPQVVKVLIKSIKDDYAAVQRNGCATLVELSRVADTMELRPFTESLAVALYTMLNHRHSAARISAVEALGRVSLHMDASGEGMRRLIMEVSPLLMDSMPLVRRECGQMGVLMLLELPDRYSYFERILPLVLCCLKDDSPEVLTFIRPLWVKCGNQFYDENEAELSQQEICDPQVENYPAGVQRPTIGCRGLVQRSLRLLQLITREAGDWKDNVRLHSLKLLYQFVLHAEAAMTAKFFEIYAQVSQACCDREPAVSAEAKKVADLLGRLLAFNAWIEHGFDGLERNARESFLSCFYYMFTAALGGTYDHLLRLCKLLKSSDYSHTLKPGFQLYILKTLETVLDKASLVTASMEQLQELYEIIYVTAMKVMALSYSLDSEANENVNRGQVIIKRIVQLEEITMGQLHERWFSLVLLDVENLDAAQDENSEPVLMLYGLIHLGSIRSTYLTQLIEKVKLVFQHCSDSAQVRIFSILSIAALSWSETVRVEREQSTQLLSSFINEIVEPYLAWKAGASGEAMRSMAMATLCALAQGAKEEAREVLPSLAKHMPSLLEDRNVTTRHYAIKAMCYFQGMSVEELKPLAYATMQRMDDPSAGIRVIAATAVGKLCPVFKSEEETEAEERQHEREVWEAFVKRAMDLLLLYNESPEKEMQAATQKTLIELAKMHPEAWEECYKRSLSTVRSKEGLADLYAKMNIRDEVQAVKD